MRLFNVTFLTILGSVGLWASGLTIANPGFESPDLTTGTFGGCSGGITGSTYIYNPTGCSQAWTFAGGSGLTHSPSNFNNPVAPDGSFQSAFLQNSSDFFQGLAGINVGSSYTLSFFAIQRICCDNNFAQTISIDLNGVQLTFNNGANTSVLPTTSGWTQYTTDPFATPDATAVLRFSGNYPGNPGQDSTAFVDQITSAEVPEPGTWGLFVCGLGGLLISRRRKK